MLKIHHFQGVVYLASDIHLGPDIPNTCQIFYKFLKQARTQADHIILVGDIFNVWIGDDAAFKQPDPWLSEAIEQLRAAAQQCHLYLMHGNRDFLLGHAFADFIGAQLLDGQVIISNHGTDYLLSHGDEYCTLDKPFMRFRKLTRKQWVQKLFLLLPLSWRMKTGREARMRSENGHVAQKHAENVPRTDIETRNTQTTKQFESKPSTLLNQANTQTTFQTGKQINYRDVDPQSIQLQFIKHAHIKHMIHGHTHCQACHQIAINGENRQRWVLPDWEFDHGIKHGGYLIIDQNGPRFVNL